MELVKKKSLSLWRGALLAFSVTLYGEYVRQKMPPPFGEGE